MLERIFEQQKDEARSAAWSTFAMLQGDMACMIAEQEANSVEDVELCDAYPIADSLHWELLRRNIKH